MIPESSPTLSPDPLRPTQAAAAPTPIGASSKNSKSLWKRARLPAAPAAQAGRKLFYRKIFPPDQVLTDLASDGLERHPFFSLTRALLMALAVLAMVLQGGLIHELIAQEAEEFAQGQIAEQNVREARRFVDSTLPLGSQFEVACHKLAGACAWALQDLAAGKTAEEPLGDIAAFAAKMHAIKLNTVAYLIGVRAKLEDQNAPQTIRARYQTYEDALVSNHLEVDRLANLIGRSQDNPEILRKALEELRTLLATPHKPSGKADLPHHASSLRTRRTGAPGFEYPVLVAAAGDVITDLLEQLPGPSVKGEPASEDTAATAEIQLDGIVAQKAAELGNDPVKIFEFVRNEFVYEPYFGSLKGAAKTLIEKAGNDMDLASALMALLRSSGIPCRYVFGTIELSADKAAAWTGAGDPNQVVKLFSQNGVPVEFEKAGGKISKIRKDHVWVKVYLDYYPYRGAVQEGRGMTWIEVDPSFKQHTFTATQSLAAQLGISPSTLLANIKALSAVDPEGNFVTKVPEPFILNEIFSLAEPLRNFLAANNLTTENVFRQRKVSEERYGILPVTDDYKIAARGMNFRALPHQLRYKLAVAVKNPDGANALRYETSLPEIADKKITLSYAPETVDDAQVLADNAEETEFPAFLVSLKPELRVNGEVKETGPAIRMGKSQDLEITFTHAGGSEETVTQTVTAGSYNALALDYQRIVKGHLNSQHALLGQAADQLGAGQSLGREKTLGDLLHGIGLSFFHQSDRFNEVSAGSLGVAANRQPSLARVAWDLHVTEQFGLPFTAAGGRVRIDIGRDMHVAASILKENKAAEHQFLFTSALTASALEHNVLVQSLLTPEAASTVRVIQAGNGDGKKIYTVTAANVDAVAPALEAGLPAAAVAAIRDAVNARQEVTVPEKAVRINGVDYVAMIKRDIDTSASDLVLNALSGGEQVNSSLKAADLVTTGPASRYLAPVRSTALWVKVTEDATTNAGLSYLPAIAHINEWYQNRASLDPVTTVAAAIALSGPITRLSAQPAILNVLAGPKFISPNGDGVQDAFSIRADVTRGAGWSATIRNSAGGIVFGTMNNTPRLEVDFSEPLPDGRYTFRLAAQSDEGEAVPITGDTVLDLTQPIARILQLFQFSSSSPELVIRGTADDANLKRFTVGVKSPPDHAPVKVFESNQPVIERVLHILDTSKFPNGPADIILTVEDQAGNVSTTTAQHTINNPVPDRVLPEVLFFTASVNGQEITAETPAVNGNIRIDIQAADNVAIRQIELLLDGQVIATASSMEDLAHELETFTIPDGDHTLTARPTDTSGNTSETAITLVTSSPVSDFKISPTVARPGDSTLLMTAKLQKEAGWTLSFSGPSTIPPINGTGVAVTGELDAKPFADGFYTVTLSVAGIAGQPSLNFSIDLVENAPIAKILNLQPAGDFGETAALVEEGIFELRGAADDEDFPNDAVSFMIRLLDLEGNVVQDLTPKPLNAEGFHPGRVRLGDSFGDLDFTLVENGVYDLELLVRGGDQTARDCTRFVLDSPLKIGHLSFSQQDLVIPVSGFPLTVIRTYNSLNAGSGDFGPSWTYSVSELQAKIPEQRVETQGIFGNAFSMRTGDRFAGRDVTLTMPDTGRVTTFRFTLKRSGLKYISVWVPPRGVKAKLEVLPDVSPFFIALGPLQYWEASGPETAAENFDFPGWILTLKDGTKYRIDREDLGEHFIFSEAASTNLFVHAYGQTRLTQITTRQGHQVKFVRTPEDGIDRVDHFNPSGDRTKSVVFERDAEKRITALFAPSSQDENGQAAPGQPAAFKYEYDPDPVKGNLVKAHRLIDKSDLANPKYEATEYLYENPDRPHFITAIKDPRGVQPIQSIFDQDGRLIETVDADGNRVRIQHDLNGKKETIFDREGNPTLHEYDKRGNVLFTTNAQGHRTGLTYDLENNQLTETDAEGRTSFFTYNGNGDQTSVTDSLGNTSRATFDQLGNPLASTDPLGNTSTNEFDGSGNLLGTTNALGQRSENKFDGDGNLTETRDARGNVTGKFIFNSFGDMTSVSDAAGFGRDFGYDEEGRQTSSSYLWTNPDNLIEGRFVASATVFDDAGRVIQTTDPDHNRTFTKYNGIDKPVETTDKLGNKTFNEYDARGNGIETRFPDGTVSRTVTDRNGRAFLTVDRHVPGLPANGTRTIFDSVGQAVRTERLSNVVIDVVDDPLTGQKKSVLSSFGSVISATKSVFSPAGRVIESTGPDGQTTRFEHDAAGRQIATINHLGQRTESIFDAAGRQVAVRDALGRETRFEHDALGRRIKTIFSDGTFTATKYDDLGRAVEETDQAGLTTNREYDKAGRLIAVILPPVLDPETGQTARPRYDYTYDTYGNLKVVRDSKGRETKFALDEQNRQVSRTLPMGQIERMKYDRFGRLDQTIDFKGQIEQSIYDSLGRRSEKRLFAAGKNPQFDSPDLTITFGFDELGREKEVNDPRRGIVENSYDVDGRATRISSAEGTINYEYDAATGRRIATFTSFTRTEYGFDQLGRLKTVRMVKRNGQVISQPEVTTYTYTAVGSRESVTLPNGVKTLYDFDRLNRLTNLQNLSPSAGILSSYAYTVAANGQRTAVLEKRLEEDGSLSRTDIAYKYDGLKRLTEEASVSTVAGRTFTDTYVMDLVGNRLQKRNVKPEGVTTVDYDYNDNDQILEENEAGPEGTALTQYGFDDNGSQNSKVRTGTNPETNAYFYNLENRLSGAQISRIEDGQQVSINTSYQYGQNGIRVRNDSSVSVAGGPAMDTQRALVIDSGNPTGYAQILEERDSANTPTLTYTIGDDILSQTTEESIRHFLYDGHGSTRELSVLNGAITDRYSYNAFGVMIGENTGVLNSTSTPILYSGEYFDPGLQQQYLRARYYEPSTGRFNAIDPISGLRIDPSSLHRYQYGKSDPISNADPSGLMSLAEVVTAVSIVLLAAGLIAPIFSTSIAQTYTSVGKYLPDAIAFGLLMKADSNPVQLLAGLLNIPLAPGAATSSLILALEVVLSIGSGEIGIYFNPGASISGTAPLFQGIVYIGAIFNLYNLDEYWGKSVSIEANLNQWGTGFNWDPTRGIADAPYGLQVSYSPFQLGSSGFVPALTGQIYHPLVIVQLANQFQLVPIGAALTAIFGGVLGGPGSLGLSALFSFFAFGNIVQAKYLSPSALRFRQTYHFRYFQPRPPGWRSGPL